MLAMQHMPPMHEFPGSRLHILGTDFSSFIRFAIDNL